MCIKPIINNKYMQFVKHGLIDAVIHSLNAVSENIIVGCNNILQLSYPLQATFFLFGALSLFFFCYVLSFWNFLPRSLPAWIKVVDWNEQESVSFSSFQQQGKPANHAVMDSDFGLNMSRSVILALMEICEYINKWKAVYGVGYDRTGENAFCG